MVDINYLTIKDYSFFLKHPSKSNRLWKQTVNNAKTNIWYCLNSDDSPSIVHQFSIDTPSKRWTIDGVSMENRWSILGGKTEKQRIFLHGRSHVLGMKNQEREKRKSHTSKKSRGCVGTRVKT